jgi:hypothetical protein
MLGKIGKLEYASVAIVIIYLLSILCVLVTTINTTYLLWSILTVDQVAPKPCDQVTVRDTNLPLNAVYLLGLGASLFIATIIAFSLIYWALDGGGPIVRKYSDVYYPTHFWFPEIQLQETKEQNSQRWTPSWWDYLFLSFNASTAFSPTDVPVINRSGKTYMMIQTVISIVTVIVIVARAINILN